MLVAVGVGSGSQLVNILQSHLAGVAVTVVGCPLGDEVSGEADVYIPVMRQTQTPAADTPLKLIQQFGVGLEGVDIPAATRAGVLVANVPSVGSGNAESVAELAICLMMMLGRQLPAAMSRFKERRFSGPVGRALMGSTVLILGYGGIGEEIARRLSGFGTRIIAVSRHGPHGMRSRDPRVSVHEHVSSEGLMAVVGEADYIVVAAPASASNVGLVDARVLAAAKPGAYLVNIARGQVVDYAALLEALRSGHLAGAGLDVFWQEPFEPADPLFDYNVIATPHVGGVTEESLNGIGAAVACNIERLMRGELPHNCVNPEIWDRVKARL